MNEPTKSWNRGRYWNGTGWSLILGASSVCRSWKSASSGPGECCHMWGLKIGYPLVICYIAIENGHRNSEFSHEKWWCSIVMLVYQRVPNSVDPNASYRNCQNWIRTSKIHMFRHKKGTCGLCNNPPKTSAEPLNRGPYPVPWKRLFGDSTIAMEKIKK